MKPAIFLDRDNTLIHNDGDLGDADQVKMIQGAASAIASLRGLGYKIVVVTNQGGVARGQFTEADVEAVHDRINQIVKSTTGGRIDRFYYCPYHPDGSVESYRREHPWRKPQPGMLAQAAKDLDLDLSRSWLIGDQLRDVQAGAAAGVHTILLQPAQRLATESTGVSPPPPGSIIKADDTDKADAVTDVGDDTSVKPEFVAPTLIEAVKIVASQRAGLTGKPPTAHALLTSAQAQSAPGQRVDPPTESHDRSPNQSSSPLVGKTRPPSARQPSDPHPVESDIGEQTAPATPVSQSDDEAVRSTRSGPDDSSLHTPAVQEPIAAPEDAVAPREAASEDPPPPVNEATPRPATVTLTDRTLREILQELRNQRVDGADFSYSTVLAIVLQMVAGVCLLGAFWMGGPDTPMFLRWIAVGLLVQLATIATLLFRR